LYKAIIFDLDGVISDTAKLHADAWKFAFDSLFDSLARKRALGADCAMFDPVIDYARYVDGRARAHGIESFLKSRGISLPPGTCEDGNVESVAGLGNLKNEQYRRLLASTDRIVFPDALDLWRRSRELRVPLAVASSSRNCRLILEKIGLSNGFDVIIGGEDLGTLGLRSKPFPDIFTAAIKQLGLQSSDCVVIEDAEAGVVAAAEAKAGCVIGLDRSGERDLRSHGATLTVTSLQNIDILLSNGGFICSI